MVAMISPAFLAFPGYLVGVDQAGHDVDGDGEDDRAVVLSGYCTQSLKISQLGVSCHWNLIFS